ncbi:AI-2E family transporter [Kineococcus sp. G2]|uniref:AI-2E family transporter n=1 Tax=Kineococcus sp. G2 TaxID=3127484 RepID=UPI00301B7BD3
MTALVVVALAWLVTTALMSLSLVAFTLAIALLLTALLRPLVTRLRGWGVRPGGAAAIALLLLVSVLVGVGVLIGTRVRSLSFELVPTLTSGIDQVRAWLTSPPLSLDPAQVGRLRDRVVGVVSSAVPSPVAAAQILLDVLTAVALALFTVFFLLKDGPAMWRWLLDRVPERHRGRTDGAGRTAFTTLEGWVVGAAAVALVDAVLIGGGLLVLGVPLWLSLTVLTFVGAFIPVLGATVSGVVAVLVTLVTNGWTDALIALGIVLVVQQVEGNLLQPLLMGRAVHLHPVVTLLAVTCGYLLLGIPGAVVAVPLVAVLHQVFEFLRPPESGELRDGDEGRGVAPDDGGSHAEEPAAGPGAGPATT